VSYYTGRCAATCASGHSYAEIAPNLFNYYVTLRRRTGVVAIPCCARRKEWLQDSSEIIDWLEARFRSVDTARNARATLAAYLFELWGDGSGCRPACARWNHMDENYAFSSAMSPTTCCRLAA
jgi:hypothetical protein